MHCSREQHKMVQQTVRFVEKKGPKGSQAVLGLNVKQTGRYGAVEGTVHESGKREITKSKTTDSAKDASHKKSKT